MWHGRACLSGMRATVSTIPDNLATRMSRDEIF
ncbi:MAG: DUF433 domain-containing protein [Anaerolineales bacterium]